MSDTDSIPSDYEESKPSISDQLSNPPPTFPIEPTRSQAIKFFITGVLFPFFGPLLFSLIYPPSGAFVSLLMPFLPLMIYSMVSLTYWAFKPSTRRFFVVRCGIYVGATLSLLVFLPTIPFSIAAIFVGPALAGSVFATKLVITGSRRFSIGNLLFVTTVVAFFAAVLKQFPEFWELLLRIPYGIAIAIGCATPTLNLLTYFRASVSLNRNSEKGLDIAAILIACIACIAVGFVTWILSTMIM